MVRNANYYELVLVHPDCPNTQPPVYDGEYSDMLVAVDNDGTVPIPDGPDPGVEYDSNFIEANVSTRSVYE